MIIGRLQKALAVDFAERKHAQTVRLESEERFRVALAAAPIVVFNQDRDLRYTWIGNPKMGFHVEDAIGRTDEELLGKEAAAPLMAIKRRVLESGVGERKEVQLGGQGQGRWFSLMAEPLRDTAGEIAGITGAAENITERKRLEMERTVALSRLTMVEEQERQRFSRELHDQTAQRIVALALDLKNLESTLIAGRPALAQTILLRSAVDDLQLQVRQIAWDLRAGEWVKGGLEQCLREHAEEWSERVGVPVDCECRGMGAQRLPALLEGTLYRLVQQALANVEQHARAHRVSVLLEREGLLVRLTVEDDGCGFDVDAVKTSSKGEPRLGLLGMKERVALVSGSLVIESSPGTGTTILARLPVPAEGEP